MSREAVQEPTPIRAAFDPVSHLTRVNGAEYLEVKHRVAWLRAEHPDAELVTEMVEHDPQLAIFKATVTLPSGGKATGYGSETASDFPDFIEKAETKAIGRALAALGYGTQFAHDDGGARRPVDAPAPIREVRGAERSPSPALPDQTATVRQLGYLRVVAREAGYEPDGLVALAHRQFGAAPDQLSRRDCSALIDLLQTGELPAR